MRRNFFNRTFYFFILICLFHFSVSIFAEGNSGEINNVKLLAGNWIGHGAGEEVRFRHKLGLLTLTVKHKTEFVFNVNDEGKVEGEGTIEYNLDNNTSGLDDLVASVHSLMGLAQVPSTGVGDVTKKIGDMATDVKGVTKIQYNAPHLKHGTEIRHFKFTGKIKNGIIKSSNGKNSKAFLIKLDEVTDFTLVGGNPDNTLIAEYEVNRVKTDAKFPCWSPFIRGEGVIRKGPGDIYVAEFQKKGTHRKGKHVWQEYGYVWMARKVTSK